MKRNLLLLPALLLLTLPAACQAKPGQLDKSFGKDGRVTTRVSGITLYSKAYFALAGEGRIVAAAGSQMIEYLPNGRLNRRFGDSGRVTIGPTDGSSFSPSGLAVDSRGRILVSGTASKLKPGGYGAESSAVEVQRFLSDGLPDAGFGNGGRELINFGFPHPSHEGEIEEQGPFVNSLGLAVDSADRPILTGSWLSYDSSPCYALYCYSTSKPYIARLQENGALDQSFGDGGTFTGVSRETAFIPVIAGEKVLFLAANHTCGPRCGSGESQIGQLSASGGLDLSFGSGGFSDLGFYGTPSLTQDHFGRTLMVGEKEEVSSIFLLERMTPRGQPDNGFGDHGSRLMSVPRGSGLVPRALAVDCHNRPILASNGRRAGKNYVIVFRRNVRGGRDHRFGSDGQTWTHMPGPVDPSQVLVGGKGRILVGGTISEDHLVLVRYLGGR
jgi:uncharacterized delta-60 repeat protein